MCLGMKVKAPEAPRPVLPREAPRRVDEAAIRAKAGNREKMKRGLRSAFTTPPGGLQTPASLAGHTLLGD